MVSDISTHQTHAEIIARNGGSTAVGRKIGVDANNVKAWKRNSSIPATYWLALSQQGLATLDELAAGAAKQAA